MCDLSFRKSELFSYSFFVSVVHNFYAHLSQVYIAKLFHSKIFRFNYQSSKKLKEKEIAAQGIIISAYTKILLNFAQIISIIACLNLDWGDLFTSIFPFFKIASGNVNEIISYECIISKNFL